MRVLIVEDEALLALNARMDISALGYQVVGIADNAEHALQIAQTHQPDVVLMDIVIQGSVNGIELTRMFADLHPQSKVIYMTAHSDESTLEKVNQTLYAGFLNKPFETWQLAQVLLEAEKL